MITVEDAFAWLNYEEGASHLGTSSHFSVWQIHDSKVIEEERNAIIDALVHCTHDFTDPLEKAEVFLNLGVDRYRRKQMDQARQHLEMAQKIYNEQKDRHRQAITDWILFIVRYANLERIRAHGHAHNARALFVELANHFMPLGDEGVSKARWYHVRVKDMTNDLGAIPEEAYEWLTKFEPTKMDASVVQVCANVREAIQQKRFSDAYHKIQTLSDITLRSPDALETAEAQAFCGLSILQMGNPLEAVRYLRSAMACATHSNHRHSSIRWMLGLVLFSIPSERCNGINHLEACLRSFEQLCQQADRQNKQKAVEWYETQLEAMKKVLADLAHNTL